MIPINNLIGKNPCYPFDGNVYEILEKDEDVNKILGDLYALYSKVDYPFSSPGNSFRRNICAELYGALFTEQELSFCEKYPEFKDEFSNLIYLLLEKAIELKFWLINDCPLSFPERAKLGVKLLSKQRPVNLEEMRARVVGHFKHNVVLTSEEEVIWNNTELTEYERMILIEEPRNDKKRAEVLLRWRKEEEESEKSK